MDRAEQQEAVRRTPFVGREAELDWIGGRVREGLAGRPRLCLVRGDRGIGKSRLLEETGRHMLQRGVRVWSAGGGSRDRTPYASIAGLFQELLASSPRRDDLARAWAAAAAQLRQVDPAGGPLVPGGGHSPKQVALSRAFTDGVIERACGGELLLLIDDFQRFDELSATVLADLVAQAGDAGHNRTVRLAVVVALRDERAPAAAVRRLAADPIADALEIQGLDPRQVDDLLSALGFDGSAPQLTDRLTRTTDGNPLYLEHLVAQLRRRDLLERRGDHWVALQDPAPLGLPEVLRDYVAESLSAEARDLLGWLAVHERVLSAPALASLAEVEPPRAKAWLEEAAASGLVRTTGDEVSFSHGLHRRAVLSDLDPADRRARHRRIAETLEARQGGPSRIEALARHWYGAWPDASADVVVEAMSAAADLAMQARDWEGAAGYFEDVLRILEEASGPRALVATLHYRAGQAYYRAGASAGALEHYGRAVADHAALRDDPGELRARIELMRTHLGFTKHSTGSQITGEAEVEEALARCEADAELRAYARAILAECHALRGDVEGAKPLVARAIAESREAGADRIHSLAWTVQGLVQMLALELEAASESFREGVRYARRVEDPWLEALALQRQPMVMAWLGRLDETRGYLVASRELAEQTRDWADYSLALGTHTAIAVARGEWREAEHAARQAVLVGRRHGYPWGAALAASALSGGRALRGDFEGAGEAIRLLEEPGILVEEPNPEWLAVQALSRLRIRALEGTAGEEDRVTCHNLLGVLVSRGADPQTLAAFCAIIDVARATGDAALATRAAAALEPSVERGVVLTATCDELLPRALAVAAMLAGNADEARRRLEQALDIAERAGTRVLLARVHLDLGELLRAGGDGAAERHLERARSLFATLGLRPLQSLRETGGEGGRDADLSEHESDYLRGLAAGLSEDELAMDLLRTRDGILRLRDRAFERIGVDGATGAIAWAMQEGLVQAPRRERAAPESIDLPHSVPPLDAAPGEAPVIWVSDIQGSTALLDRVGDVEGQALIREHNAVVRDQLARHGGSEVQHTGDGFIATFPGAGAAIRCAVDVQRALAARPASPVAVRVGIHTGDILFDEGRLVGIAMNTTARICGACEGAEILVSDRVVERAEALAAPPVDLGPTRLRGIHRPIRLHRIGWEEAPM